MMNKSELRKARKTARLAGLPLTGELAIPRNASASNRTKRRAAGRKRAQEREKNQQS